MPQDQKPSAAAQAYFEQGYACAPSVLMAFAEQFNLPIQLAAKLAAAFGGGMSRTGRTCGAVSGALMVIGLHSGSAIPGDVDAREITYAFGADVIDAFTAQHGSVECPDLLDGCNIGISEERQRAREQGFFTSRCPIFVRDAAEIVEKILK